MIAKQATPMLIAALGCALAGCTPPLQPAPPPRALGDTCIAEPGQAMIGRKADAPAGAELLRLTNSREIRWVGPNMVVTMEYKLGRVTVGYDAAMIINNVACN